MAFRLVLLACCIVILNAHQMGLSAGNQLCSTDKDCKGGCCIGIGKLKLCHNYLKEGEACTMSLGCGCAPGLSCIKVGTIAKECLALSKDCGKPAIPGVRVIGGKTAVRGSWPWQIVLNYIYRPICGATLISPRWAITAAHCVYAMDEPDEFSVTLGEYDLTKKEGSEVKPGVDKYFIHPKWDRRTFDNDIALLRLYKPVKFNKYISPACLPTGDAPVGSTCYVTGWGSMKYNGGMVPILQQGKLPVVSNEVCNAKNWASMHVKVTENMICGGDGGKSSITGCHGDSGGPYVCNINGRWEIQGAVSYGPPKCNSKIGYSVFSRVSRYMDWIIKTISEN